MSLTSYLTGKNDVELRFQEIIKKVQPKKTDFKTISGNIAFDTKKELLAPYNLKSQAESSIIGTAFDYCARFLVSQKIEGLTNYKYVPITFVAEGFFIKFESQAERNIYKELLMRYKKFIKKVLLFTNDKKMDFDEEFLQLVITIARMELSWRGGVMPSNESDLVLKAPKYLIDDLTKLIEVFKDNFLKNVVKKDSKAFFNPTFGVCSSAVDGADADIIIDEVLYDFKSSKKLGYVGKDIRQLMSYFIFSEIDNDFILFKKSQGQIIEVETKTVKRIAIYKARGGEINYIDISDIEKQKVNLAYNEIYDLIPDMFDYKKKKVQNLIDIYTEILEKNKNTNKAFID